MAKTFLFRVTQEGVDELRKNLEALGPSGQRAFQVIADASPRLANSLGQAEQSVGKTRTQLEALRVTGEATAGALDLLNKGLGLFGLGLGIEKMVEFGKGAIETAGSIKDLSTQIGVTTQQFQVYQYAARQNGVATQAWQSGLSNLSRLIGEANAGNKDAIDLFQRLHIAYQNADGSARDTGAAARDLAQRVHDSATAAQQAAITHDALGKVGRELIPVLKDGAEGFDKWTAAAQKAGEVLSDDTIERLNKADTTFKNLGASIEIFFAEGIDQAIKTGQAFGYMTDQLVRFAEHKIDVSSVTGQITALERELKNKIAAFNGDANAGFRFYSPVEFGEDQRRIIAQINFLKQQLTGLTTPQVQQAIAVAADASLGKAGHSGSDTFVYKAASSADQALQAGADQIDILRKTFGLTPADRSIEQARLSALYGARRNPDPSISGAADQFADQAKTQAILKQTQAIADQNRQIDLNVDLTGKATDAWLQSEAAGQKADAERQGALQELTTGYSAAAAAANILAQEASDAALKGAQQLLQIKQQTADLEAQAAASANGPAALAAEQLREKIAASVKDLQAALANAADPETADRLRTEIDGITKSLTDADTAAKQLKLNDALSDQQDQLASLQKQYDLVGQISSVQAVEVAHLEAINQLLHDGADLSSQSAQQYIANAEQIAGLKDKLAISQQQAELMLEPYKNAIQGLQSDWTDGWEEALSGNVDSFKDFFGQVKQLGIKWAAEMASLLTFRPAAGGLLSSLGQDQLAASLGLQNVTGPQAQAAAQNAQAGGGFGNILSASSGIGSWLNSLIGGSGVGTNASGFRATGAGPGASAAGALPGYASFLNGGVGTGLVGAGVAAGTTAATGGSTLQTLLSGGGALLGGIAGSYFGGPAGAAGGSAIGGFLGNLVGGLFGSSGEKKPPKQRSITNFSVDDGLFGAGGTRTSNTGDHTSTLGTSAANAINAFLASIGAKVTGALGGTNQIYYSGRSPNFGNIVGGEAAQFGGDAQGAQDAVADFIARTVVEAAKEGKLTGASTSVVKALANSNATTSDAIDAAVQFGKFFDRIDQIRTPAQSATQALADLASQMAQSATQAQQYGLDVSKIPTIYKQNFNDTISDQILQISDPNGYALKQLDIEKAAAVAQAQKLGADINAVEELYGLKRQAIVQQGLQGVNDTFQAFFNSLLTDSNLSALSPQAQLAAAQSQYATAKTSGDASSFTAAAQQLLQVAREFYASSQNYADIFKGVLTDTKTLSSLNDNIPAFASGGDFPGGYMLAGEQGAELIASGPARVFDAKTTAAILGAANADFDPKGVARLMRSLGEHGDNELVHMRTDELDTLSGAWGQPAINPATGLPGFYINSGGPSGSMQGGVGSNSTAGAHGGNSGKSSGSSGNNAGGQTAAQKKAAQIAAQNAAYAQASGQAMQAALEASGDSTAIAAGKALANAHSSGDNSLDAGLIHVSYDPETMKAITTVGGQTATANTLGAGLSSLTGTSMDDYSTRLEAYSSRYADYKDWGNTGLDDFGNFLASMLGFNEIAPTFSQYGLTPDTYALNANWGFDPVGLVAGLAGTALGIPGVGLIADQISKWLGRPLEMNLGQSVIGSPDITAGLQNGLAAGGAPDIASVQANSTLASFGPQPGGVLASPDTPHSLSSAVAGTQNTIAGQINNGFQRASKGTDQTNSLLQSLLTQVAQLTNEVGLLRNDTAQTNNVLKVQARGSNKV